MMINVSDKNIKNWSIVGPRAVVGLALSEIVKENKDLMVVTADVSTSAGLDRYRKTYPYNYVDTGIAEQNMIGIAAGLADNGFKVFTTTFAPFQILRCCEQIKVDLSYTNIPVTMIGLASGLINGPLGNTHCCIEDIGVLRSLPNLIIISPCDGLSVVKAINASLQLKAPSYIRITGGVNNPIIYNTDFDFEIGKFNMIRSGDDAVIFVSGSILSNVIKAAEILSSNNINVTIFDAHTIKPLDTKTLAKALNKFKFFITVEEHNIIGGLGSAVAEFLSSKSTNAILLKLGINDVYLKPGNYDHMLSQAGLSSEQIASSISEFVTING